MLVLLEVPSHFSSETNRLHSSMGFLFLPKTLTLEEAEIDQPKLGTLCISVALLLGELGLLNFEALLSRITVALLSLAALGTL